MKRIARGPVRGISLVLQEEERERRDNYVPAETILASMVHKTEVDDTTKEMLAAMCDFGMFLFSQIYFLDFNLFRKTWYPICIRKSSAAIWFP